MAIKHILALLRGIGDEQHVAAGAMALAQRFKAHVTATNAPTDSTILIDPTNVALSGTYYTELQQVLEKETSQRRLRARTAFDQALDVAKLSLTDRPAGERERDQPSASWLDGTSVQGPAVQIGRVVDLVVTGRPGTDLQALEDVEDAMFAARRPVLILPHMVSNLGQHAALAWNGSSEAAVALRSAVDLLQPGGKVTIVQIGDIKQGGTSVARVADYLGWHGFTREVMQLSDQSKSTPEVLITTARAIGADMMVMGAYSHSRFRETILGGVTTHMLRECDMPVLMGH
jgi:nucleotide-binding universal stress UspA family protein